MKRKYIPVGIVLWGIVTGFHRWGQIRMGNQQLHPDAAEVWYPVAKSVLSGTPLYTGAAVDNKPPLWEIVNLLVASTGHYVPVFQILIGLVNGVTAVLLYRYLRDEWSFHTGLVGAFLFFAFVFVINGTVVNVRSLTSMAVLGAFIVEQPFWTGLLLGTSGMISQFAIFALPGLAIYQYNDAESWTDLFLFGIGLVLVPVFSFLAVLAIWGKDSFLNAIFWSVGSASQYTAGISHAGQAQPSLLHNQVFYVGYLFNVSVKSAALLIPAAFLVAQYRRDGRIQWIVVLLLSMSLPLLIRSFPAYWMYPLPWLSMLSAIWYTRGHVK